MNFERGKDVKEALHVGIRDPKHLNSISISVKDPNIVDDRPHEGRRWTKNPQIIFKERIVGKDVHKILNLLKNNMKFPWDFFFKKYPDLEAMIKQNNYRMGFYLLLEKEEGHRGFPFINLRQIVGKHIIYEGKPYFMKEKRP